VDPSGVDRTECGRNASSSIFIVIPSFGPRSRHHTYASRDCKLDWRTR
jgi:hypothetical protein